MSNHQGTRFQAHSSDSYSTLFDSSKDSSAKSSPRYYYLPNSNSLMQTRNETDTLKDQKNKPASKTKRNRKGLDSTTSSPIQSGSSGITKPKFTKRRRSKSKSLGIKLPIPPTVIEVASSKTSDSMKEYLIDSVTDLRLDEQGNVTDEKNMFGYGKLKEASLYQPERLYPSEVYSEESKDVPKSYELAELSFVSETPEQRHSNPNISTVIFESCSQILAKEAQSKMAHNIDEFDRNDARNTAQHCQSLESAMICSTSYRNHDAVRIEGAASSTENDKLNGFLGSNWALNDPGVNQIIDTDVEKSKTMEKLMLASRQPSELPELIRRSNHITDIAE